MAEMTELITRLFDQSFQYGFSQIPLKERSGLALILEVKVNFKSSLKFSRVFNSTAYA